LKTLISIKGLHKSFSFFFKLRWLSFSQWLLGSFFLPCFNEDLVNLHMLINFFMVLYGISFNGCCMHSSFGGGLS
jgi:hypothetical protein